MLKLMAVGDCWAVDFTGDKGEAEILRLFDTFILPTPFTLKGASREEVIAHLGEIGTEVE